MRTSDVQRGAGFIVTWPVLQVGPAQLKDDRKMASTNAPPFWDVCPRLHELNSRLDAAVRSPDARQKLLALVAEFAAGVKFAEQAEADRQQLRRDYFLRTVFEPGNAYLRDGTSPVDGLTWAEYTQATTEDIEHLRHETYYGQTCSRPRPGVMQHPIKRRCKCWGRRNHVADFLVWAWAPPDLAAIGPEKCKLPQPPVPPRNLGRDYTLAEIAYGLAQLHDADGGFSPFLPDDHPLYTNAWWLGIYALNSRQGVFNEGLTAQDKWHLGLEPHVDRLIAALGTPVDDGGRQAMGKRRVGSKRSRNRGEAQVKILAALTRHHNYADGSCLNQAAITNSELARQADVSKGSVTLFFNKQFNRGLTGGRSRYVMACSDSGALNHSLQLMNGEVTPAILVSRTGVDVRDLPAD